jgi:chitinase
VLYINRGLLSVAASYNPQPLYHILSLHIFAMYLFSILSILLLSIGPAFASLNLNQTNNLAVYWGQNSGSRVGATAQGPLSQTCEDTDINIVLLAFLVATNNKDNVPELNFANQQGSCDEKSQPLICNKIATEIATCQKNGKTVLLSIGGSVILEEGYKSQEDAEAGAEKIWAMFGPPQNSKNSAIKRPFGDVVVDGFDLDFEDKDLESKHLNAFSKRLRALMSSTSDRKFYLSAAPQCPGLNPALTDIHFDMWFIQFYNNPTCDVRAYGKMESPAPSFAQWNDWATNNKTKMFVGLPAFSNASATDSYVPPNSVSDFLKNTTGLNNVAGVSLWDAAQAFANNNYHKAVKTALNGAKSSS